jgi:hypothetical protein
VRLRNLLEMPGGIAEQGREVSFRLRYSGKDGAPLVRDVTAMMLPLSQPEIEQAEAAARKAEGRVLLERDEFTIRILQAMLRDTADPSKHLIEDEADLRLLRAGLVPPQYRALLAEYELLMATEYPEQVTEQDAEQLEKDAAGFSEGG